MKIWLEDEVERLRVENAELKRIHTKYTMIHCPQCGFEGAREYLPT